MTTRLVIFILAVAITTEIAQAQIKNGFDLSGATIPPQDIHHGGPPRDGIPAIDQPRFVQAKKAGFLEDQDRVLGIERNGITKAYPIAILNWHEIVNDRFSEEAIVVSFCPLCGTGVAFAATSAGQERSFGVSGLLYNSDVLLYDRQTESLWSQLLGKAVTGPLKNTSLKIIPMTHTSWLDWRKRHPDTLVLSTETGHRRDYRRDPYASYEDSEDTYFPVSHRDPRYHPKERVIGIEIDGDFKAYPFAELSKSGDTLIDSFAGHKLRIIFDGEHQSASVYDQDGREIPGITGFWFAWIAFHPDTEVYQHR